MFAVPPSQISIQSEGEEVRGDTLTVTENVLSQVSCVTRLSNPAPTISWRLGTRDLPSANQTSVAEAGVRGKVRTEAVLEWEFSEADRGEALQCLVAHPAYSDGSTQTRAARLDVLCRFLLSTNSPLTSTISDLGTVSISSVSSSQLQDGVGTLSLSCTADASPSAQVMWVRTDTEEVVQYGPVLEFSPVLKQHNGRYSCTAWNSVGNSTSEPYLLNVLCK